MCDDTLVQYAAYLVLSSLRRGGWYHSIPIILVGMALHFFFSGQFLLPLLFFLLGVSEKRFNLATLLISGVVDHPCEVP